MKVSRSALLYRGASAGVIGAMLAIGVPAFAQDTGPAATTATTPEEAAAEGQSGAEGSGQEIIVTGSRLATGFSAPTPVSVISAERLEQRAITNIAEALNDVPSFRATQTPAAGELGFAGNYVGGRILDLRGLGPVRTLTLVDGKRFVPSTIQATVDTNMIPSIMLARSEVVTGGASAAYGSDAVAGVVNLILNRKLTGFKANAQTSITKYGDGQTYTIAGAGGFALSDTLHFTIGGEWEKSKGIGDCQERPSCRTETLNFGRNPRVAATTPPTISGNNILPDIRVSTVPFNGVTTPTTASYTNRDFPLLRSYDGITFSADGTPRRFVYGTRSNNLYMTGGEGEGENIYFKDFFNVAPTERYAIASTLDWEITPDIKATLTGNYGHLNGEYTTQYYRNPAIVIGADNPFIPRSADPTLDLPTLLAQAGATNFTLGKGFPEFGRSPTYSTNKVFRIVGGLEGKLGENWSWDAYYQFGKNKFKSRIDNAIITQRFLNALDAAPSATGPQCRVNVDASLTNNDPACVAYNPFGQRNNAASIAYINEVATQTSNTTEHVVAGNLRGDLFELPYGPLAIAVGGEYRSDKVAGTTDQFSQALRFYAGNGSAISGKNEVTEGYIEAQAPLLVGITGFNELSVNGAARRTHYKRTGGAGTSTVNVTTWKVGAVWEPVSAIRFRATKSRDIRAPNVAELFGPVTASQGIVTDPIKGQTVVLIRGGANPTLLPEKADTFTAGVVLKPGGDGAISRLRFSADFYDIKIENAISTLGQQAIISRCAENNDPVSCSLVTRDPVTGFVTNVVDTLQNVNQLKTRGIDFELSYRQPLGGLGDVDFRLLANYVKDLIIVDIVGPTDRAGQTGLRGGTPAGQPDWVFDGLVSWNYEAFTLNTHVRYINKGFYNAAFIGPDAGPNQDLYNINLGTSTNTQRVPARTYVDLLAQYKVDYGTDRSMTFYAGADNVFNTSQPLNPGARGTGNNILFSPNGTTFKAGVRVTY